MKITFAYPWINAGSPDGKGLTDALKDLTYSLRSLEQHYCGQFNVAVVGDCPPNLGGLIYIPHARRGKPGQLPKALDAVDKMRLMLACPHITDTFVYMSDDVVLNQPTTFDMLRTLIARADTAGLAAKRDTSSAHHQVRLNTLQALQQAGVAQPYDYETHLPRVFVKRKMHEVLHRYQPDANRLMLSTLYYNHHFPGQQPDHVIGPHDPLKAFVGGQGNDYTVGCPPTLGRSEALAWYQQQLGHRWVVNWNDQGVRHGLRLYLNHRFPDRSVFETSDHCWVWDPTTVDAKPVDLVLP